MILMPAFAPKADLAIVAVISGDLNWSPQHLQLKLIIWRISLWLG